MRSAPASPADPRPAPPRRKGVASRAWLVVSATGGTLLEEVWKHSIMRRTGLPARDLRVLDPLLSYPSTILGRERAIVINLEHIKAIITATEVLVANSKDILVMPFVQELQARVANLDPPMGATPLVMSDTDEETAVKAALLQGSSPGQNGEGGLGIGKGSPGEENVIRIRGGAQMLPFEFKALEVCLESACRCLESEASILKQEAYPALDELMSKISTLNLERVRQIKSRLVAISGRVQKVRDELEHLLDDDMDMAEMYLTEKLVCQPANESPSRVDIDTDVRELDDDGDEDINSDIESSSHGSLGGFKPNIEELEMLLEAYFVQIDGTLNKLSTLREYVDDTEDYINIMLDEKQNQLLQMGVMLSTATLVVTAGVSVVGVFGMNITIGLYNTTPGPGFWDHKFWETTGGTLLGCIVLYIIAIGWGKKSGLLQ